MSIQIKISAKFAEDRSERDLSIGEVIAESGRKVTLTVDNGLAGDLIDDAAYQGWFTDSDSPGIIRAARTAFRDMIKQGLIYRHGVKFNIGGLIMPRDANLRGESKVKPEVFKRIRTERLGMTQSQLAAVLRIDDIRTIRRWETGERSISGPVTFLMELLDQGKI